MKHTRTIKLRQRMECDKRSMQRRRRLFVRLIRAWLEEDGRRIDDAVERMKSVGLFSTSSADKDCRFSIVRTMARIDGANNCDLWHAWMREHPTWLGFIHKRRRYRPLEV